MKSIFRSAAVIALAVASLAALPLALPAEAATPLATSTLQTAANTKLDTLIAQTSGQLPYGATSVTASATGTTAATTATLPAVSGKTNYLCGFSIRANATAAATGDATVTGAVSGTLHFTQWTAPLASGIGVTSADTSGMCIAASAVNTAISVVSAAPGSGGTVSVSVWGYVK